MLIFGIIVVASYNLGMFIYIMYEFGFSYGWNLIGPEEISMSYILFCISLLPCVVLYYISYILYRCYKGLMRLLGLPRSF